MESRQQVPSTLWPTRGSPIRCGGPTTNGSSGSQRGGQMMQVVFVLDPDDTVFVIHARMLTDREKQKYRKRRKGEG